MRTLKYILPALCLSFISAPGAKAEDSIVNRNVTVEREYKPVIQGAGKINSVPKILEPGVDKITPRYSNFNLPMNAGFNIHTLDAAELQREKRQETNNGFARAGIGNRFNTLADFAYPLIKTPDMRLDFSLNHLGTFGSKAHSTTRSALSFDKYFKNFNLYAGMGGGYEYLKYYGHNYNSKDSIIDLFALAKGIGTVPGLGAASYLEQNSPANYRPARSLSLNELANDSSSNSFWRFNAFAGIRSLASTTGVRYKAEMEYKVFDSRNGLVENQLHTKGGFNTASGNNRLGIDLNMYNLSYRSYNTALTNYLEDYTVFTMNPYYSIERESFDVRLGVKTSFSFMKGHPFNPSVDVHAEWRAIPKYLSFYGGITGDYTVNTMDKMFNENRYLNPDLRIDNTYSPFELYLGMKLKPLYNLLVDAYVDYREIDNQYFFVNKEYKCDTVSGANSTLFSNRFSALYSNASHLKIGVRANYNIRNELNIQFKGAYNGWETAAQPFAWNKPKWEADLSTDIRLNNDFTLSANVFYEGERYAKLGNTAVRMKPKTDINLGLSYLYNDWITLFVKTNNLINSKYQDYYGYDVQGFNGLLGAAISF